MFWGRVQDYWLPTPLACFPFTSPPVHHRVTSGFNWALHKVIAKWLRWSRGSVLTLSTKVHGFIPSWSRQDFSGWKNPQHTFLREGIKPWVPCRIFAACKRSLNWRGSRNLRQNYQLILAHIVPPYATRISASLRTWGYLATWRRMWECPNRWGG